MKNMISMNRVQGGSRVVRQSLLALAAVVSITALLAGTNAVAAEQPHVPAWGTSACPGGANFATPAPISVPPSLVVPLADYGTGGVALRNRGAGVIHISGVVPPVSSAWIYWAVISAGPPPAAATGLRLSRIFPTPVSGTVKLKGVLIGVGAPPCWPGDRISVFRAQIPLAVATGNGEYQVTLLPGAAGTTDGSDPFLAIVDPLWDGASIIMIGAGAGTVSIYDAGLAGNTFVPSVPFAYTLVLPFAGGASTILDNIGADGQHSIGPSRTPNVLETDETTAINGFPIAGWGSPYLDSDWNGSSGLPVPELWDDTGHDITDAAKGMAALNVVIFNIGAGASDCLATVANVVRQ